MKLPNGDRAEVLLEKLTGYALCPDHPQGRHKARVFARALGLTTGDAELLRTLLLRAAAEEEAAEGELDDFGQRYVIDFTATTTMGTALVRSAWICRTGSKTPTMITCYVLE
jgi:hypothetical protein